MMTKYLHNPLTHDVTTLYAGIEGIPTAYTLPAEKTTKFTDEAFFAHMRDYLVAIILNERSIIHFDENRLRVREEITKHSE